jgi:hypothetical protein
VGGEAALFSALMSAVELLPAGSALPEHAVRAIHATVERETRQERLRGFVMAIFQTPAG